MTNKADFPGEKYIHPSYKKYNSSLERNNWKAQDAREIEASKVYLSGEHLSLYMSVNQASVAAVALLHESPAPG